MNTNEDNNKEVSFTDSQTESQINSVVSETESKIMEGLTNQSTPIPVKEDDSYEVLKMTQTMFDMKFNERNVKFDERKGSFNARFDEVNAKMNDQMNEIRNEIKQQNVYINKSLKEVDEHLSVMVKQIQDEINENRKRKEGVENGTYNKVSGYTCLLYTSFDHSFSRLLHQI